MGAFVPTVERYGPFMRLQYQRFLRYFLLVTFTGISLLGEGLHWLTPETEHHYHHRHGICFCQRHGHGGKGKHSNEAFVGHSHASAEREVCASMLPSAQLVLRENGAESHVCKICAYRCQILSEPLEVFAPFEWQPLVFSAPSLRSFLFSDSTLSTQAPRGPPILA